MRSLWVVLFSLATLNAHAAYKFDPFSYHSLASDATTHERVVDVISKTKYLVSIEVAALFVMTYLPESFTQWDPARRQGKDIVERWLDNVSDGPIWDEDPWAVNYIGHPLIGAWYYGMARSSGLSAQHSFLYSFIVSTFIWEYGIEATYEIPSWQDMFTTPVGGFFLGETFRALTLNIEQNDDRILGSRTLGLTAKFFMNPLDVMSRTVRHLTRRTFGISPRDFELHLVHKNYSLLTPMQWQAFDKHHKPSPVFGLGMTFAW